MYNIIKAFIDHEWVTTTNQGDQAYIYCFAFIIGVVLVVKFIDLMEAVFSRFMR